MLHHSGLAVNVLFEACAFFLSDLTLKVRGTFVTDIFVKAVTESGRIVRIEFTPNMPPTPLVHGLEGGTRRVLPGEPPLVVEDLSVAVAVAEAEVHPNLPRLLQNDNTEILRVRTAGWAIEATARPIQRSATRGKKQVDLSFAPLRDPLAPNPKTGKVVAPHGLVGQSFDGDDIAVDGKKDRCAPACPPLTAAHEPALTHGSGARRRPRAVVASELLQGQRNHDRGAGRRGHRGLWRRLQGGGLFRHRLQVPALRRPGGGAAQHRGPLGHQARRIKRWRKRWRGLLEAQQGGHVRRRRARV